MLKKEHFLGIQRIQQLHSSMKNIKRNERLVFVNPAFYFPRVTYTQTTLLGSTDFSPGASVEKERKLFMIIYQKGIHQRRN